MEIAIKIVLIIHLLGMAMIVGGALHQSQEKAKNVTRTMLDGAYTQVLTGLILVGLVYANDENPATWWVATKFSVAVAVLVIGIANRKKTSNNMPAWGSMLGLTLVNVIIAVFWH